MKVIAQIMICAFIAAPFSAIIAQKLPNVQQVSISAPADVKIDGKLTEWGDQLQAYNKNVNVFYTIANDDKNLYLVVQTPDPALINKILGGGVSFTINKTGKKTEKDAINITYPVLKKDKKMFINFSADANKQKILEGITTPYLAAADSFAMLNNNRLAEKSKYIMVTGIKGLDTLISVYNQDGIKAKSIFSDKMIYSYELAVDLKLLGFNTDNAEKFAYHFELPGLATLGLGTFSTPTGSTITIISSTFTPPDHPVHVAGNPNGYNIMTPTDFWGEYTLAKK
ncbi:MAG TPA: hypothetical protein VL490_12295 [Mucilaginibacter sp.]|jgi:hypothetical protein|nr:hypothetical protein [Mucilaginibacter sp.]